MRAASFSRCATAAIRSPNHSRAAAGSCSHHHIAGHMQPRPPAPLPVLKAKGMISLEFAAADGGGCPGRTNTEVPENI
jgi:hypothetical protein